jgi:hypothetical protein
MFTASEMYAARTTLKYARKTWTGTPEFTSARVNSRSTTTHFNNYMSANLATTTATPHQGYYDSTTGVYFLIKSNPYVITQAAAAVSTAAEYAVSSTNGLTWTARSGVANGRFLWTTPISGRPYTRMVTGALYGADSVGTTSGTVGASASTVYYCKPVWFDNNLFCSNNTGYNGSIPLGIENTGTGVQTAFTNLPAGGPYTSYDASPDNLVYVGRRLASGGVATYYVNKGSTAWNTGRLVLSGYQQVETTGYSDSHIPIEILWTGTKFILFVAMYYNSCIRNVSTAGYICSRISVFESTTGAVFTHLSDICITDYRLNDKFSYSNESANYAQTDFSFDFGGAINSYRNRTAAVSNGRIALGIGIHSRFSFGVSNASDNVLRYVHPALLYSLDDGVTWHLTELTMSGLAVTQNGLAMLGFTDLIGVPDGFMGFYKYGSSQTAAVSSYLLTNSECMDIVNY